MARIWDNDLRIPVCDKCQEKECCKCVLVIDEAAHVDFTKFLEPLQPLQPLILINPLPRNDFVRAVITCLGCIESIVKELQDLKVKVISSHLLNKIGDEGVRFDLVIECSSKTLEEIKTNLWVEDIFIDTLREFALS